MREEGISCWVRLRQGAQQVFNSVHMWDGLRLLISVDEMVDEEVATSPSVFPSSRVVPTYLGIGNILSFHMDSWIHGWIQWMHVTCGLYQPPGARCPPAGTSSLL